MADWQWAQNDPGSDYLYGDDWEWYRDPNNMQGHPEGAWTQRRKVIAPVEEETPGFDDPGAPGELGPAAPITGPVSPPVNPGGYIPYTGGGGGDYGGGGGDYGGGGGGGYGDTPMFNAPRWQAPPEFVYNKQFAAPNQQELQNDPSFQFRLDQGRKALEQSAAGKGVLRTGGTLKDLVNYGQNFATNEYSNVYNRKFGEYKFDYDKEADIYSKNYGLKRDVFDRNYKAAYDEYAPKLRGYEMNFNRDWQRYTYDRDKEQQDMGSWPNP